MTLDAIALSSICVMQDPIALTFALDVKWVDLIRIKRQKAFWPLENNQGDFLNYAMNHHRETI